MTTWSPSTPKGTSGARVCSTRATVSIATITPNIAVRALRGGLFTGGPSDLQVSVGIAMSVLKDDISDITSFG